MSAKHTKTPWDVACDSYGKVQHSRKACVYANTKGDNGDRIVTIAGRIENWDDAAFIVRACNAHDALVSALAMAAPFLHGDAAMYALAALALAHGQEEPCTPQ